jgi:rubrerythrin
MSCRRAALSEEVQAWAEEVALDEQGHVRMVREVRRAVITQLLCLRNEVT